jgi:hypothetical protein
VKRRLAYPSFDEQFHIPTITLAQRFGKSKSPRLWTFAKGAIGERWGEKGSENEISNLKLRKSKSESKCKVDHGGDGERHEGTVSERVKGSARGMAGAACRRETARSECGIFHAAGGMWVSLKGWGGQSMME